MTLHAVGWTHVCVGVQLRVMLSVLPGGEDHFGAERNQGSGNLASLGFVADIFGKSGDILDSPLLPTCTRRGVPLVLWGWWVLLLHGF